MCFQFCPCLFITALWFLSVAPTSPPGKRESFYLTEGGREAFDQLYRLWEGEMRVVSTSTPSPIIPLPLDSQTQLVSDLLNVLIGVTSTTFPLNQVKNIPIRITYFFERGSIYLIDLWDTCFIIPYRLFYTFKLFDSVWTPFFLVHLFYLFLLHFYYT